MPPSSTNNNFNSLNQVHKYNKRQKFQYGFCQSYLCWSRIRKKKPSTVFVKTYGKISDKNVAIAHLQNSKNV